MVEGVSNYHPQVTGNNQAKHSEKTYDGGTLKEVVVFGKKPQPTINGGTLPEVTITARKPEVQADGTTLVYHQDGTITTISADKTYKETRTPEGDLVRTTRQEGNQTVTRQYENGDLASITSQRNSGGHLIEATYTSETGFKEDRPTMEVQDPQNEALRTTMEYEYDNNGNMISMTTTDPSGNKTTQKFDNILAEVTVKPENPTGEEIAQNEEVTLDGGTLAEVVVTGKAPKKDDDVTLDGGTLAEVVVTGKAPKKDDDVTLDGGTLAEVVVTGKAPKKDDDVTLDGGTLAEVVVTG
ncbi:hypothetical protein IJ541_07610, partial [bacterium]|nr:hypothetical protein [bacterium]